ncbi:MAG: hypothetical protein A3A44_02555 [Candidatus Sungbacteria bacterium RIFCSPLOWO2_01_FULL_60_25]|uniref:Methyltransferase type 11 domain-containing protein n=1 Tax=Candidatus Sungbacteria bacterium RIFCSPLOWO2_01_FULL_60_25 TaxID=1802281 RepID=A0A1G2LAR3_9BACT|nr:MAG: hypothetical protein A3A44_02555 [Candidatus Sungbacteria bacterium RIFCSPLOWO2_01_FULL_60_25]
MDENAASPIIVTCPLSREHRAHFSFSKNHFDLYLCRECDFRFVYPMPDDTKSVYGSDYFIGARRGFGYVNYEDDKVAMRGFFERALDAVEGVVSARGTLLDVGAATGFFLKIARERGWRVAGLEVSSYAVSEARRSGLGVVEGTLESSPWQGPTFDAITLFDVIEHVPDPRRTLARAFAILRPGGAVAINTPDTGSFWGRAFGRHWHAYCPPEHLSYFNQRNIQTLARECGFETLSVTKIGKRFTPAYIFSMLRRWQGLRFWRWMERAVLRMPLHRLELPVNIRDNMFLVVRKPAVLPPVAPANRAMRKAV